MQSSYLKGQFLISINQMQDPNFRQTVILVIAHDTNGAFGLIVNRPTDYNFAQVIQDQSMVRGATGRIRMYFGGPVQSNHIFVLHSGLPDSVQSEIASSPVANVVFDPLLPMFIEYLQGEWSALPDEMRPPVRFYAGYAGWGEKQLEQELLEKAWIVRPSTVKHIFHPNPEHRWWEALSEMGEAYRLVAMSDIDPTLN